MSPGHAFGLFQRTVCVVTPGCPCHCASGLSISRTRSSTAAINHPPDAGGAHAASDATRQMFAKGKSIKPSQWRNPNNLQFEGLRCIVALQACRPTAATPFREEIVGCLRSSDLSLRYLAADVLYNSCSADNLASVADQVSPSCSPAHSGSRGARAAILHLLH